MQTQLMWQRRYHITDGKCPQCRAICHTNAFFTKSVKQWFVLKCEILELDQNSNPMIFGGFFSSSQPTPLQTIEDKQTKRGKPARIKNQIMGLDFQDLWLQCD